MAQSHVVSTLSKKRGELIGSIRHYQEKIQELDRDLDTVEMAIMIFEPDFDFRTTKVVNKHKKNNYFKTGEAKMTILNLLRIGNKPELTDDIVSMVALGKSMSFEDKYAYRDFKKVILNNLKRLQKGNILEQINNDDGSMSWSIIKYNQI